MVLRTEDLLLDWGISSFPFSRVAKNFSAIIENMLFLPVWVDMG